MKIKYLLISLLILFCVFLVYKNIQKAENKGNKARISINSHILEIEIASNFQEQKQGLSNRDFLCENCGMLFQYKKPQLLSFWMGEMQFPLDIIFFKDNKIIEIFSNVPVFTNNEYTQIKPKDKANLVLEINAGWSLENSLKIGDSIDIVN